MERQDIIEITDIFYYKMMQVFTVFKRNWLQEVKYIQTDLLI
jgi:hypothetical protein